MVFLIALAVVSGVMAATAQVWMTGERRAKEQELLFAGNQFREALAAYYRNSPGGAVRYPQKLDDLLEDNRYATARRYLRKIFADPMTGKPNWELMRLPDGGIIGVHSVSDVEPIKKTGFRAADFELQNKSKYSEWTFMYLGVETSQAGSQQAPAAAGRGRTGR